MNKLIQAARGRKAKLAALALVAASGVARAAADTTAIDTAKTDALAFAAAVAGVMIAIWAAKLAYRKFFGG